MKVLRTFDRIELLHVAATYEGGGQRREEFQNTGVFTTGNMCPKKQNRPSCDL